MGNEILSNKEIKNLLKEISEDENSPQEPKICTYDFRRTDFLAKRQKDVIKKLFCNSDSAYSLELLNIDEYIKSCTENAFLFRFRLNGKICLASLSKKSRYTKDNPPVNVLKQVLQRFKEEFEIATETLPYYPLDFSHFYQIPDDESHDAKKTAQSLFVNSYQMGLHVLNYYYDDNLNRKTKDEVEISLFLDKDEVKKIADLLSPEQNIVEWKDDCNAVALLGGFNWSDEANLKKDDIIPLNTMVTSPLPIIKDGKIAAFAEVMCIDENFGLKITEVVEKSPEEIVEDALEKGRRECEKMFGITEEKKND
ncbi:MAG: FliM/FliN family flagellar motor C-terminal domain-containing protein [Treponema sp.]|nr:FliM/FliN family flagellar motor C-terminal domain-containing protein [Treponema sp.]